MNKEFKKLKYMSNFLLIILLCQSCMLKKVQEYNKKVTLPDDMNGFHILGRGYFTFKKHVYYSNGKDSYCALKNWDQFNKFQEKEKLYVLGEQELPTRMKMLGRCEEKFIFGEIQLK